MKNMINLLKLNYTSMFVLKKSSLIILGLIILITISNKDGSMLPFAGALIIMMLDYSTLAYEDKSKINYLVYTLPIKSKDYILSKYIYGIINIFLSICFSDIVYIILKVFKYMPSEPVPLSVINISIGIVGFIMVAIVIPIGLVVGFNKGRIILMFLAIIPMCFSNVIVKAVSMVPESFTLMSLDSIVTILSAIGMMLTLLSYFICSSLYAKKDID